MHLKIPNLKHRYLHHTRLYRKSITNHRHIWRQYFTVTLVMGIAFLPVRLFFYTFITPNWLGNLGLMTMIALLMFYLVKKNKLGKFGIYFSNRIRRFTRHKIFYFAFISPIFGIGFYVWILYEIDFVEDEYQYERELFFADIIYVLSKSNNTESIYADNPLKNIDTSMLPERFKSLVPMFTGTNLVINLQEYDLYPGYEAMNEIAHMNYTERYRYLETEMFKLHQDPNNPDFIKIYEAMRFYLGNGFYLINVVSGTWYSHIVAVWIMGQGEIILLLFFYRKYYRDIQGIAWDKLGFSKKIRRYAITQHAKRQIHQKSCKHCGEPKIRLYRRFVIWFNYMVGAR